MCRFSWVFASAALLATATRPGRSDETPPQPGQAEQRPKVVLTDVALALHRQALLVDGHNDLPWQLRTKGDSGFDKFDVSQPQPMLDTDLPRLRKGGVGAQFWSAYAPVETIRKGEAAKVTLEQIDLIRRLVARYPDDLEMAYTADDIERIHGAGKIAALIGVEGGHAIENSLESLRRLHGLGARYMTLAHTDSLDWVDSATDAPRAGGLSAFGEEVVRTMNSLGMLVDISHISAEAMHATLRVARAPVIASHSSAFAVAGHPRNVPDDVLREVAKNGGVIMVNFYSGFIVPERAEVGARLVAARIERRKLRTDDAEDDAMKLLRNSREQEKLPAGTVHTLVDHIDHIIKVAGVDHVGLGSDYDGVTKLPAQLEDVSCYPYITQELLNRGRSPDEVRKILGENLLRAMRDAERVARASK
ncbi:MAG: membrane dipeptidase [Planctomycetia bacterium]|nr:membrane dipeptidase [Planctomycetia bacterium]